MVVGFPQGGDNVCVTKVRARAGGFGRAPCSSESQSARVCLLQAANAAARVPQGVVSRIDRQQYSHGRTSLLAIQVDAAINSGNSGGAHGRARGGGALCVGREFCSRSRGP